MIKLKLIATLALLLTAAVGTSSDRATAATGTVYFPQTGQQVSGRFLAYWQQHGGLIVQGYPLSGEFKEQSELNTVVYQVQYFERAVFEYHPENQPPNDVLLSQLGTYQYRQKYGRDGATNQHANPDNSLKFKQTGKTLGGGFRTYWESNGGVNQLGYPISDEFSEESGLDGKSYTVQYFERAVFEYHPENQPPYNVLLSQLGRYRYMARYQQPAQPSQPLPDTNPTPAPSPVLPAAAGTPYSLSDSTVGSPPLGGGNHAYWLGNADRIISYDPSKQQTIVLLNTGAGRDLLAADESTILWREYRGGEPAAFYQLPTSGGTPHLLELPADSSNLALDHGTLYYVSYSGQQGAIYSRPLSGGVSKAVVSFASTIRAYSLVAHDGNLLWSEGDSTFGSIGYRLRLHSPNQQPVERVLAGAGSPASADATRFSYDLGGDYAVWTEAGAKNGVYNVQIYNFKTQAKRSLAVGEAGGIEISGQRVVWAEQASKDGISSWGLQLYDLQNGQQRNLLQDKPTFPLPVFADNSTIVYSLGYPSMSHIPGYSYAGKMYDISLGQ